MYNVYIRHLIVSYYKIIVYSEKNIIEPNQLRIKQFNKMYNIGCFPQENQYLN